MAEAIAVRALGVRLGAREVLRELSFSTAFGELLAVLGPNGAGKSTLLRTLAGLTTYTGELTLLGRSLAALSPTERARAVTFVPQQSQLSARLRVHEVVALGRYAHRPALAQRAHEHERAIALALTQCDVASLRERAFSDLSSGEQKRVLLARALATEARVLLLDEPTSTLDLAHALQLFELLRALAAEGRAVVVVLHQLEHALRFADRALLLRGGTLLDVGAARAVITPASVRALFDVELVEGGAPAFRLPGEHRGGT